MCYIDMDGPVVGPVVGTAPYRSSARLNVGSSTWQSMLSPHPSAARTLEGSCPVTDEMISAAWRQFAVVFAESLAAEGERVTAVAEAGGR